MVTILATWELGRNFGHVAHAASLARGLTRRRVRTVFAARDVVTASGVADRPFAAVLQAPVFLRAVPRVPTPTFATAIADGGFGDADAVTALVAAWLVLFDGVRPDGIVADLAPVSLLAAHVAGLPAAQIGTSWSAPPPVDPLPSTMPWLPDDPAARRAAGAVADAVVRTVCSRFGAPPLDGLSALLAAAPRRLQSWPELDHYGWAADTTYYGPSTGIAATARPEWPAAEGPRVFVYLPGDADAAAGLSAALGRLGWPVIWHGRVPPPQPLPPSIAFSPAPVDLAHVLGGATLLAGRGGQATACAALRLGVRQLVLPDTLETRLLGWRMERQRLAVVVDSRADADTIGARLQALAGDAGMADAAAAAAARYHRYDPDRADDELARDICGDLGI